MHRANGAWHHPSHSAAYCSLRLSLIDRPQGQKALEQRQGGETEGPAPGSLTLPSTTSPPLHHVCQAVRSYQPTQQVPSHGMKEEADTETLWLGVSEGCSQYKGKEMNTNPACALRVCVYSSQTCLVFPSTCRPGHHHTH